MSIAPLHILIAMHYHCSGDQTDYAQNTPHGDSSAVIDIRNELADAGLLSRNMGASAVNRLFEPTDALRVWVEGLCGVPYPEQRWIIPWDQSWPVV